jgi:hypothetical protein
VKADVSGLIRCGELQDSDGPTHVLAFWVVDAGGLAGALQVAAGAAPVLYYTTPN